MKLSHLIKIFIFFLINSIYANKFVIGDHAPHGFFDVFLSTLNKLIYAKIEKKIPVIYWGEKSLYYQKNGYNGSYNVWEYYFEPVSNLKIEPGDSIYKEYTAPNGLNIGYIKNQIYGKNFHNKLKFLANSTIKKYIRFKPQMMKKIKKFYNQNMKGKNVIGIHLRGTDKKSEAKVIDPKYILKKAKSLATKKTIFFIATDEQRLLELAKSILNNVIYTNCKRSTSNKPIHYPRSKDAALLGEEVLIDMVLLSKCDIFVHTLSNVATTVMFFNPNIKNIFLN